MHSPTEEQSQAIEAYLTGENLRIEALAGTGKTTTLRMLVERGSPRRGKVLYTSFGAKVIKDAKARFPSACRVATNHSLAWGVGKGYRDAGRLQGQVTPYQLIQHFGWRDQHFAPYADARAGAYAVREAVNAFCQSADTQITTAHALSACRRICRGDLANATRLAVTVAGMANEVWAASIDPTSTLGVSHDTYLKAWALTSPRINATTILLDEAQDTSELMVDLLQKQDHAQLVIVGDRYQAIYAWRGAISSMDAFEFAHSTSLTQSFRFGDEIAEVANAILEDQCNSTVKLRGYAAHDSVLGPTDAPHCYLARTNAVLVGQLFEINRRTPGYKVGVVGGTADMVKLVEAAAKLKKSEPVQHPELAEFSHWGQVHQAVQEEAYSHLRGLVTLVDEYGTANLLSTLDRIGGNELDPESCDVLLSTAHKAKGSEFQSVKLLDDFVPKGPDEDPGSTGWTPECGNLLYVAATRAQMQLDATDCSAVVGSLPPSVNLWASMEGYREDEGQQSYSDADAFEPTHEAWAPRLLEGQWPHPLIKNGVITVTQDDGQLHVAVEAQGHALFEASGSLQVVHWDEDKAAVLIGTGWLEVPIEAMENLHA
ncbi:MAG: hypothetical protein A2580_08730 [Hydrogenophilales bacterium RIFOXYD1_FULL_62_11]|nr:MAG: hypothetical protein A2580_08730 [Hydrogenophilales bacterium RIFOXYD1_FULL_62_11]